MSDTIIKIAFKFDPNSGPSQGRWRLRDPKDFDKMWTEKDEAEKGISYIVGTLKSGGKAIQAVRFQKSNWTEAEAGKWWNRVKGQKKYKKIWQESDWTKWKKTHKDKKSTLLNTLIKLANSLDDAGHQQEANAVDGLVNYAADKPWVSEDHDWDEVLIDKDGIKKTRGQIRDYYMQNAEKILPYLKDKDVIILIGTSKNKTTLKRNRDGGERIHINKAKGIDDPQSLEYWANRRLIELHPALGATTDMVWVDLDPHTDKMRPKAKQITSKVADVMKKAFPGVKVRVWDSGKRGYHVVGELSKAVNTDEARNKLKEALDEAFEGDPEATTGLAKDNQIRLDTTTLKNTGSIRAPYSFSVDGRPKVPLNEDAADDIVEVAESTLGPKGLAANDVIEVNEASDAFPFSFMRLKKIKSPDDMLDQYKPEDLVVQIKIDGFKIAAVKKGDETKLFSRRGKDVGVNVPALINELNEQLPKDTMILGEVVVLVDGKQTITETQTLLGSKSGGAEKVRGEIVFYVYDVLKYKGKDTTQMPFIKRDELLRKIIKPTTHIQLLKNYTFDERNEAIEYALSVGGEGIVIKPKSSTYLLNKNTETESFGEQAKFKPSGIKANTEDVILESYEKGESKLIFPAFQYDNGEKVEVARVSGMDKTTEAELKQQIDAGKAVVVEVSYQERLPSKKLRHIGFVRVRPDKAPKDATIS